MSLFEYLLIYRWLGENKLSGNIPDLSGLKELETLYVTQKDALFLRLVWVLIFLEIFI